MAKKDRDKTVAKSTSQSPDKTGGQQDLHLVFHAQYIKDVSFENPNPPFVMPSTGAAPQIHINCSVASKPLKDKPRHYEISLMLSATAKQQDEVMFIAEVTYGGDISVGGNVDEKNIHPLVMIEGPRHLFPFARMLMNSIVREGGFLPLNIQPIDFVRLYQQRLAHMKARQEAEQNSNATGASKKNGKA